MSYRKSKKELLDIAKSKIVGDIVESKLVKGRSTLEYRDTENNVYCLYHRTNVVTKNASHMIVRTNGYHTPTTRERISRYLPANMDIIMQESFLYLVEYRQGKEHLCKCIDQAIDIELDQNMHGHIIA